MIDLHSHILPETDDGAKSLEETLRMAEIAVKEGIKQMVATPHYIPGIAPTDSKELLQKIEMVNQALQEKEIDLQILPGNEAYISLELPEKLQQGEVLPINHTSYVLVEFPMMEIPAYAEDVLYEIRLLGYKPIIAHPERYRDIIENPNLLKGFIDQGNYTQLNAMSVTGGLGKTVQATARKLLECNMIHCIGTDSHSPGGRSPKIKTAIHTIEGWIGEGQTRVLLTNNGNIIKDEEIFVLPIKSYTKKKNLFYKLYQQLFYNFKKAYHSRT